MRSLAPSRVRRSLGILPCASNLSSELSVVGRCVGGAQLIKPEVFAAIMDFFASGQPLLLEGADLQAQVCERDGVSEMSTHAKSGTNSSPRAIVCDIEIDLWFPPFSAAASHGRWEGCVKFVASLTAHVPPTREWPYWPVLSSLRLNRAHETKRKASRSLAFDRKLHLSHRQHRIRRSTMTTVKWWR